jgi:hypothetical protein
VFENGYGFGDGFVLDGESGAIIFESAVDDGRALSSSAFPLSAHEWCRELPTFILKEYPDQAEVGGNIVGIDFFTSGWKVFALTGLSLTAPFFSRRGALAPASAG